MAEKTRIQTSFFSQPLVVCRFIERRRQSFFLTNKIGVPTRLANLLRALLVYMRRGKLGRVIKRKIVSSRSFSCQISLDHFSGTMGCPPFHHPDTLLKDAMNIYKLNPHPSYVILQTTKCVGTAGKWYCSQKLKGHNSSQLTNSCTASLNARIQRAV